MNKNSLHAGWCVKAILIYVKNVTIQHQVRNVPFKVGIFCKTEEVAMTGIVSLPSGI